MVVILASGIVSIPLFFLEIVLWVPCGVVFFVGETFFPAQLVMFFTLGLVGKI